MNSSIPMKENPQKLTLSLVDAKKQCPLTVHKHSTATAIKFFIQKPCFCVP